MINRKPQMDANATDGVTLPEVKGAIDFVSVDFSYPSRPGVMVFKNFSLSIARGKTVAIVGSSGSGKSTVISLIERFYDPLAGVVSASLICNCVLWLSFVRPRLDCASPERLCVWLRELCRSCLKVLAVWLGIFQEKCCWMDTISKVWT